MAFPLRSPHAVHSSSTTTVSFHFKLAGYQRGRYLYYLYICIWLQMYLRTLGLSVVAYLGEWVMRLNCTNLDINRGWQGRNQYWLAFRLIMPHQGKFQMGFDRGHSARKLLFSNRCIITKCNYRNEFAFSSIEECNLIKYEMSLIFFTMFTPGIMWLAPNFLAMREMFVLIYQLWINFTLLLFPFAPQTLHQPVIRQ